MITRFRSRLLMSRTSRLVRRAAADERRPALTASSAVRSARTVSSAAGVGRGRSSVAWNCTRPSTTFGCGAPALAGTAARRHRDHGRDAGRLADDVDDLPAPCPRGR